MKLRNKKTGEILGSLGSFIIQNPDHISCEAITKYDSLAELNEEWEDYEEPKEHWCITMYGGITRIKDDEEPIDDLIEIGNYFNSKEDAYDALDKLKAWKRLKDKVFKVDLWDYDGSDYQGKIRTGRILFRVKDYEENDKDLDLLFGGEE